MGIEQEKRLDLLDARERAIDLVDLAADQVVDFRRTRQARIVGEGNVVVLRELLDVFLIDQNDRREIGAAIADPTASVTYGENFSSFSHSLGVMFLPPAVMMMSFMRSVMRK